MSLMIFNAVICLFEFLIYYMRDNVTAGVIGYTVLFYILLQSFEIGSATGGILDDYRAAVLSRARRAELLQKIRMLRAA